MRATLSAGRDTSAGPGDRHRHMIFSVCLAVPILVIKEHPPMLRRLSIPLAAILVLSACGDERNDGPIQPARVTVPALPEAPVFPAEEPLPSYDPDRDPAEDITEALAKARKDKHPVLIDFGAGWCPDCVVLGETFRKKSVRRHLDVFHVVAVDVGELDRNLNVAKKYGLDLKKSGIPALVVLSPRGKVKVATNDGSFAKAGKMPSTKVVEFLKRWA
ncbi:thioredoxin family protein [Actinocorallia sp. B10E7]|uniref:thioredoxin family protein n=1 Tax=Actinocorallia sp. B10E7 TaxID=3153558 RepID=UPI00325D99E2